MKKNKKHFLSVVIPAYKQEKTIAEDLKTIKQVLDRLRFDYEMVVVVDGQTDRTLSEAKKINSEKIKVIGYRFNKGKGHAVRYGIARTKGDLIAFIDAGMDIDPEGIPMLLEHLFWYNSDIIVGSIRHSASKVQGYPVKRKILSWVYHRFTRFVFGLKITDSQRGLKIFRRAVLEKVLPRLMVKKYAFDIEMLSVAHRLGFQKIHDGPVEMDGRRLKYSSITTGTIWNMLIETLAVFYRLKILHYYDDGHKRQWRFDPELNFKINI